MSTRRAPVVRKQGFTLIELTLATATAAVLALALYSSLNIAMTAREAANRAVELDRQAALVADLIVRDLEAVLPPTGTLAGPFIGSGGGTAGSVLSFHAFPPTTGDGSSDLPQRVELELRPDVSPPALVRRLQPNLLAPSEAVLDEEVLARGVTTFTLRYYDGIAGAWMEAWDSSATDTTTQNVLPRAVEVTIVLEREGDPAAGNDEAVQRVTVVRVVPMPIGSDVAPETGDEEPEAEL